MPVSTSWAAAWERYIRGHVVTDHARRVTTTFLTATLARTAVHDETEDEEDEEGEEGEEGVEDEEGVEGEEGEVAPGWVVDFTDETVTIDLNHPLAGEHLHFEVEICSVRDATQDELKHGHPHGAGGHEH